MALTDLEGDLRVECSNGDALEPISNCTPLIDMGSLAPAGPLGVNDSNTPGWVAAGETSGHVGT